MRRRSRNHYQELFGNSCEKSEPAAPVHDFVFIHQPRKVDLGPDCKSTEHLNGPDVMQKADSRILTARYVEKNDQFY